MDIPIFNDILNIIYPPTCLICKKFISFERNSDIFGKICKGCLDQFISITSPVCTICGRPFVTRTGDDHPCESCIRERPFFDELRAPYLYEGPVMDAIHLFKYGGRTGIAEPFGTLMSEYLNKWQNDLPDLLIIPVPLHRKRLRERKFNQSLLIARQVSEKSDNGLDFLTLRRTRETKPQTGLKRNERQKNVRRAFALKDPMNVKGRTILLVDDVATTGSTLNECARVLKKAGVKTVLCLVFARPDIQ